MRPRRVHGAPFLLLVSALLAWQHPGIAQPKQLAFPDGTWQGQPLVWHGTVTLASASGEGSADVDFQLTVEDAEVTAGTMTMKGQAASFVEGPPAVTVDGFVGAKYKLGGTAGKVTLTGQASFDLIAKPEGFPAIPIKFTTGTGKSSFSPSFVTCNKVTGDLATEHEKAVQAHGISANISAAFVALRVAPGAAGEAILAEVDTMAKLIADLPANPKPADLLAVAEMVDAFNAKIAGLGGCDAAPPGYEKGLQDTLISAMFQGALETAIGTGEGYSAQELLSLLGVGMRVGAVGLKVPGAKTLKDPAKALFFQFESALNLKVDAANAAGDQQTIIDILIAAQQYGMDDLAAKAQGALATVGQ